jgi:hypothetical protein
MFPWRKDWERKQESERMKGRNKYLALSVDFQCEESRERIQNHSASQT